VSERIVSVVSTNDIVLATIWRDLLRAEGIPAELGGSTTVTSVYPMMGQISAIDLFVRETDAVRARGLIDAAGEDAADEEEDPGETGARDA
jgi:hypothetical protein